MEVIWTKLAKITYVEVIENLKIRWTFKEIKTFYDLTNNTINSITSNQIEYPYVNKRKGVKKAIIHKNVSLFFREDHQKLYLITFFNNRMNPETLKKLLKNE
uniref:hypothetical protein n=1 Tax=Gelidibacter sp. TaxID=2018083 RepID=UPI004049B5B0